MTELLTFGLSRVFRSQKSRSLLPEERMVFKMSVGVDGLAVCTLCKMNSCPQKPQLIFIVPIETGLAILKLASKDTRMSIIVVVEAFDCHQQRFGEGINIQPQWVPQPQRRILSSSLGQATARFPEKVLSM